MKRKTKKLGRPPADTPLPQLRKSVSALVAMGVKGEIIRSLVRSTHTDDGFEQYKEISAELLADIEAEKTQARATRDAKINAAKEECRSELAALECQKRFLHETTELVRVGRENLPDELYDLILNGMVQLMAEEKSIGPGWQKRCKAGIEAARGKKIQGDVYVAVAEIYKHETGKTVEPNKIRKRLERYVATKRTK